jgi:GMP synthase PP-ATPase subunit/8-oxo-dGTP pyrophosphatase MutT (NUDIX family)
MTTQFPFLAQGTLYPDVVESNNSGGKGQVIKSHHNVGGLPEDMQFELVEPLRDLFKDEVREVGRRLGVPSEIVDRHPFPGPGLAIRIIGEITTEKLDTLRLADKIFMEELKNTPNQDENDRIAKFATDSGFWKDVESQKIAEGVNTVLAIIVNSKGEVFTQKRLPTKKTFPNIWEVSCGGHIEENETILQALEREITEETGWKLKKIYEYAGVVDTIANNKTYRCFPFFVEVDGDLSNPKLELDSVSDSKWIDETGLDFVEENLQAGYKTIQLVQDFFVQRKFREFLKNCLYSEVWQAFCVLTDVKSVGVMGDGRTYENLLGLRAVTAVDGMTADWAHLPYEFLGKVSNRIINEVRGINRVAYDISSKPPATIEWE